MLNRKTPHQAEFDEICRLAINQDEVGLRLLLANGRCKSRFMITPDGRTPSSFLAKQDHTRALNFLIEKFNLISILTCNFGTWHCLFRGYAEAGMTSAVNFHLAQPHEGVGHIPLAKPAAAEGYAFAGKTTEVNDLIASEVGEQRAQIILHAISGYARAGNVNLVESFISLYSSSINNNKLLDMAVFGYAKSGLTEQVNDLIQRGADINSAARAYALSGHVYSMINLIKRGANFENTLNTLCYTGLLSNEDNILHTLSLFDSDGDRSRGVYLIGCFEGLTNVAMHNMEIKARKMNQLKKMYDLTDYSHVCSISKKGAIAWVAQTLSFQDNQPSRSSSVLINIASHVLGLPYKDTNLVSAKILERIAILKSKCNLDAFTHRKISFSQFKRNQYSAYEWYKKSCDKFGLFSNKNTPDNRIDNIQETKDENNHHLQVVP